MYAFGFVFIVLGWCLRASGKKRKRADESEFVPKLLVGTGLSLMIFGAVMSTFFLIIMFGMGL